MPLSLVGTFGVMYLLGYSLDNLSLMALTISTGFVVDDAIVVTENIARFVEEGDSPREAALEGAKQIGFTIVSITVSLLAVFIPILLMGGIVGRLFREFAVTLSDRHRGLGGRLAHAHADDVRAAPAPAATQDAHGTLYHLSERVFDGMLALATSAASSGCCATAARCSSLTRRDASASRSRSSIVVPKGLFPQQDTGLLMGFTEAPQDVSFPAMRERSEAINEIVQTDPDVEHVVAFTGGQGPGGGTGNTGTMFIGFKAKPGRKASADQVIARLRAEAREGRGHHALPAGRPGRARRRPLARTQYQYTLQRRGPRRAPRRGRRACSSACAKLPELKDVATDQQTAGLELDVDVDRDTASRLGVTPQTIDDTLYDAFGQRQVATTYTQLNQYRVVLEVKPELRRTRRRSTRIYVRGPRRRSSRSTRSRRRRSRSDAARDHPPGPVPVRHALVQPRRGRRSARRSTRFTAPSARSACPRACTASSRGHGAGLQGVARERADAHPRRRSSTVYIVLGMLYESFVHPITILSTLPSAGVGALLALLVDRHGPQHHRAHRHHPAHRHREEERDHDDRLRDRGRARRAAVADEAIHKACLLRFRPIMMTTLAALLGALPLALGTGMGSELRRPLGIAIVGGLLVSQMLTLFTTPVIYLTMDRGRAAKTAPQTLSPTVA